MIMSAVYGDFEREQSAKKDGRIYLRRHFERTKFEDLRG